MNLPIRPWTVLAAAALLLGAPAAAQEPAGEDLLRGPTVSDDATRTLVRVDADGSLVRVQGRPEEAALELVLLDPQHRDDARKAAAERRIAVGMLLVDNIDLVRDGTDAIRAGDRDKATEIYRQLYDRFEPEHGRDPLLKIFAEILSPEELEEVTRIVNEYWEALIASEVGDAARDADPARKEAERRLAFAVFQQEVGEAYNWSLRPFRYKLETLYEITQPTPEQRKAIRGAIIDYIRESRLEPTPQQQQRAADLVYSILDEEQRKRLFEHLLWQL